MTRRAVLATVLLAGTLSAEFSRNDVQQTVTDSITGLVWQDDGAAGRTQKTFDDAVQYCKSLTLGGLAWRLPSIDEMITIRETKRARPAIVSKFVNVAMEGYYFSSTPNFNGSEGTETSAWTMEPLFGGTYPYGKTDLLYVRCVSGGNFGSLGTLEAVKLNGFKRDDTKEIVTDANGLMWQDDATIATVGKGLQDAMGYCSQISVGGFTDWRLPSVEELTSIVDYRKQNPAQNSAFKNYNLDVTWTSTPAAEIVNPGDKWSVNFDYGKSDVYVPKADKEPVRCVRGQIVSDDYSQILMKRLVTATQVGSSNPPPPPSSTTTDCNDEVIKKVTLTNRWHLIGALSEGCTISALKSKGATAWTFDPAANNWKSDDKISMGEGFWIIKK